VKCLTSDKPFNFGADRDHDPDPGKFNGIFINTGWGNCKNFAPNSINDDYNVEEGLWDALAYNDCFL